MKKTVFGFLLSVLLFIITCFLYHEILVLSKDYLLWGFGALLGFVVIFMLIYCALRWFGTFISHKAVVFSVIFGIVLMAFLDSPSLRFGLKVLPTTLSFLIGALAASIFLSPTIKQRSWVTLSLFLFPLLLNIKLYDTWVHVVEFGNLSGKVQERKVIEFAVQDEDGNVISNQDLKGKVVVLDFWFIGCGPCWKKFPHLQELHEKYSQHPNVAIYAVNRPMSSDRPRQSFEATKAKGYDFTVLQGSQQMMDDFGIYVYPTVVILDKSGEIIYMGQTEGVEKTLQAIL